MTLETALSRLEHRTEQLARMVIIGAPAIMLEEQRRLVAQAQAWVDSPPPGIPD